MVRRQGAAKRGRRRKGGRDSSHSQAGPNAVWVPQGLPPIQEALPVTMLEEQPLETEMEAKRLIADAMEREKLVNEAADTIELLLSLLAPSPDSNNPPEVTPVAVTAPQRKTWPIVPPRLATEGPSCFLPAESFLGRWYDSQGNRVEVASTDAYEVRLEATLSRPPRADIRLCVRPVMLGGGWQCGHSMLDPHWSSRAELHWVTADGRVSVWTRPQERAGGSHDKAESKAGE